MNFNYLLPGEGRGRGFLEGITWFSGVQGGGGESSLTEYEGGTFRKLKANEGIIRTLQSVWGGGTGKFFGSKKNPQTPVPLPYAINHARSLKIVEIFNT